MKISIIKSILCPNDSYLDINCNAIINLIEFLNFVNRENIEFDITIIGWIKKESYGIIIKDIIDKRKSCINKSVCVFLKLNYGKFVMFNKLQKIIEECDYVFYLDHDILFNFDNRNIFLKLMEMMQHKINDKRIGLIALNHLEDNRHKIALFDNSNKLIIDDDVLYHNKGNDYGNIACGCIFLSYRCFRMLDGLDTLSVYGLDDYHMIKKICENNFIAMVAIHMYIIHPFDMNSEYANWKKNTIKLLLENKNFDYYKTLESSINFWE